MDGRLNRTNSDEAEDYVVPNVLSPKDLVSRPDNMDETVQSSSHTCFNNDHRLNLISATGVSYVVMVLSHLSCFITLVKPNGI